LVFCKYRRERVRIRKNLEVGKKVVKYKVPVNLLKNTVKKKTAQKKSATCEKLLIKNSNKEKD
jgi:hypothetical protein